VPADAVDDAARIVPLATMAGTGLSAVVSLIATCAVVLLMPAEVISRSSAPISDFIAVSWGDLAGGFVAVCAVVSCFGCLNGYLLVGGALPVSMAESGTLPRWFAQRNAAGAPARAIVVGAVVTSLLAVAAYTRQGVAAYNFAILLATATNLVIYVLCAIAAIRFMRSGRIPRSAGLTLSAIIALLFAGWALYGSGRESVVWGGVLLACGWPVYAVARRAARA
jgi:basic amino acid/polyamine antiporter, APA family